MYILCDCPHWLALNIFRHTALKGHEVVTCMEHLVLNQGCFIVAGKFLLVLQQGPCCKIVTTFFFFFCYHLSLTHFKWITMFFFPGSSQTSFQEY